MTTIEQNSGYATLINVFTVEPDRAAELAGAVAHRDPRSDAAPARIPIGQHPREHRRHARRQLRAMGQRRGLPRDAGRRYDAAAYGRRSGAGDQLRPAPLHRGIGTRALAKIQPLEAGCDPVADLCRGQLLVARGWRDPGAFWSGPRARNAEDE